MDWIREVYLVLTIALSASLDGFGDFLTTNQWLFFKRLHLRRTLPVTRLKTLLICLFSELSEATPPEFSLISTPRPVSPTNQKKKKLLEVALLF